MKRVMHMFSLYNNMLYLFCIARYTYIKGVLVEITQKDILVLEKIIWTDVWWCRTIGKVYKNLHQNHKARALLDEKGTNYRQKFRKKMHSFANQYRHTGQLPAIFKRKRIKWNRQIDWVWHVGRLYKLVQSNVYFLTNSSSQSDQTTRCLLLAKFH